MAHTKRAIILLPPLRDDEQNFKDEHEAAIAARHLVVSVNGIEAVNTQVALDLAEHTVGGIPAGSTVQIDLSNVLSDGHEGLPVTRTVTAPPEPQPIPQPDPPNVRFEDEGHEPE